MLRSKVVFHGYIENLKHNYILLITWYRTNDYNLVTFIIYSSYKKLYQEEKVRHSISILYQSNAIKIWKLFFTYTLLTFLLDYGKRNLLKTHKVFFTGLATVTAVKNQKTQHNERHNDTKQRKKLKKSKLQNNYLSRQVCITSWHWLFWWLRSKLLLEFALLGK